MQQGGLNEGALVLEKQVVAGVEEDLLPGIVYALSLSLSRNQSLLDCSGGATEGARSYDRSHGRVSRAMMSKLPRARRVATQNDLALLTGSLPAHASSGVVLTHDRSKLGRAPT